jgi:hypothetical protein
MRGVRMRTTGFSMQIMRWQVSYAKEKPSAVFLGSLFLVLALSFVPVFQAAHALTHVDSVHEVHPGDEPGLSEIGSKIPGDIDRVCIDCLALTAFSIISFTLAIPFRDQMTRHRPLQRSLAHIYLGPASLYSTRAPPRK